MKEVPLGASPVKKALFLKKVNFGKGRGIGIGRNSIFEITQAHAVSKKLLKKITQDFDGRMKPKNRSFDLDREN